MKRKLNSNDVPVPVSEIDENITTTADAKESTVSKTPKPSQVETFADLQLDSRLLQAIAAQNWSTPTPVQISTIPYALKGKDVLARAKTGTGKTAAYLLPILQSVLKRKEVCQICFFSCIYSD